MIGKIISKAADSEDMAIVKSSLQEEGTGEASVFKSLLDSLQGDHSSAYKEDDLLTGMLSDNELESLTKEKGADQVNQQAGNIFRILSDGNLKDEDLKSQLRQLLNQLKQDGQGQAARLREALGEGDGRIEARGGQEEKGQVGKVISEMSELLSNHLSGEEMGRLTKAVESGQINKISGEISRLLSDGNLENEDVKTQLRQLLNQLKQDGQGQAARLREALGEGNGRIEARGGQEEKRQVGKVISEMSELLSNHLSGEEMGRLTKAVESGQINKISGEISRLLSDGNLENEDVKTQLRQLLNQLKQEGQGQAAQVQETEGAIEKAPTEDGKKIEKEVPNPSVENKEDRFMSSKNDDQGMVDRGKSLESTFGKGNKDLSLNPLEKEKRIAGNVGSDSKKNSDADLNSVAGRKGRMKITEKQKELIDNFFLKGGSGSASEQGLEIKSAQLEKALKKEGRERDRSSFFGLSSLSGKANRDQGSSVGTGSLHGSTESSEFSADEQEIMWKEYTTDSGEAKEEKETVQQSLASSSLKLGQIPIANGALRKKILPGLTQNILKAASEAKKNPEQWQKHNFILDDGKEMQLSVREAKGVLQVKMGSMNLDLSKLLQQHLQQIREHLRQEFGTDIDLQLDNPAQEGPASHFSESSPNRGNEHQTGSGDGEVRSDKQGKAKLKAVRNFGYNQMEWTA